MGIHQPKGGAALKTRYSRVSRLCLPTQRLPSWVSFPRHVSGPSPGQRRRSHSTCAGQARTKKNVPGDEWVHRWMQTKRQIRARIWKGWNWSLRTTRISGCSNLSSPEGGHSQPMVEPNNRTLGVILKKCAWRGPPYKRITKAPSGCIYGLPREAWILRKFVTFGVWSWSARHLFLVKSKIDLFWRSFASAKKLIVIDSWNYLSVDLTINTLCLFRLHFFWRKYSVIQMPKLR